MHCGAAPRSAAAMAPAQAQAASLVPPPPSSGSADGLQQALEQLGPQAAETLVKHFDDPEFRRLFGEYARDMADPKTREEEAAYLAQLEAQGELEAVYGQGVTLLQPEPGFVIKTKTAEGATRVYINVCTSPKVEEMRLEAGADSTKPGRTVVLPCSMLAKKSRAAAASDDAAPAMVVWDMIVHPNAVEWGETSLACHEHLILMAIERVESAAKTRLLRKFKLPRLAYKGPDGEARPSAVTVRVGAGGESVDGHLRPQSAPVAAADGTAGRDAATTGRDAGTTRSTAKPAARSGFTFAGSSKRKQQQQQQQQRAPAPAIQEAEAPAPASAGGVVTPEYQVIERAPVDLAAAWQDTGRGLRHAHSLPEALVVRVSLPGVCSAAGVQLAVTSEAVRLEVPGKYLLQLPLSHSVHESQGTAKFVTAKQQLVLTLPVVQPAREHRAPPQEQQQHDAGVAPEPEPEGEQQPAEEASTVPAADGVDSNEEAAPGGHAGDAVQPVAAPAKTETQLRWEALHAQASSAAAVAASPGASSVVPAEAARPCKQAALLRPCLSSRCVAADDFM